ncbi:nicotinamidase/pyrazinamidase [Cnuella takakiae]|uniref:Nicotinamidase n=1 Tax=Cnuella takakiae TaxID=1302690 RepID=A0A1M4UY55_9BACT|nr:bifunctional nicotinamidase/pyrazinamidase [Cnuella takakiae]OLY92755.1 nicotinamidase [Cnuella takakiae]SHE61580.1 nicotinamidase/pyrazinamidase [Cnuella takakiae]
MDALILVDIQPDFLPGGALAVPDGNAIIPVVNQLVTHFDLVVATQDWHPSGHGSFASAHKGKQPFEAIDLYGLHQVLWPDHCVQGSAGAALSDAINWDKIAAIFRKGMNPGIDSYSGFYDNGYRKRTGLDGYLKALGVQRVFVAGLAADYCVYYTAKDALKEGFDTVLIEDATRPIDASNFKEAKADLKSKGASIMYSSELLGR